MLVYQRVIFRSYWNSSQIFLGAPNKSLMFKRKVCRSTHFPHIRFTHWTQVTVWLQRTPPLHRLATGQCRTEAHCHPAAASFFLKSRADIFQPANFELILGLPKICGKRTTCFAVFCFLRGIKQLSIILFKAVVLDSKNAASISCIFHCGHSQPPKKLWQS